MQEIRWILILEIVYTLAIIATCLRIIYDTRSTTKTLAYLMLTVFLPILGIVIYFCIGTNYRKRKLYSKKIVLDEQMQLRIREQVYLESKKIWDTVPDEILKYQKLAQLLLNDGMSYLTGNNKVQVLLNGEQKFPEVLRCLREAKDHIHIEYYIFEDDHIGNAIKDILIEKAKSGVRVRLIYDDFGSRSIRKNVITELREAGVEAYPFYRILFIALANRINYRNHRKIIVIDGHIGFTGGINVSDRYINTEENKDQVFWRDTHVKITGTGAFYLQYLFICDWNFCADEALKVEPGFFYEPKENGGDAVVQIAASGPDSDNPTILFSLIQAIGMAEEEILITTPYFIPGESLLDAMTVAALSGVRVVLLVPDKSDSRMVAAAARSFYSELLAAGVEIYQYEKGFIHAKTMVSDQQLSVIGTANMDNRSFELNFEVNAVIYDNDTAEEMTRIFYQDLKVSRKIDAAEWEKRPLYKQLPEKLARLLSPLL
ncbi:cardiolipin synthase [Pedobacter hartonius]|uniref:Cardiolipin synthase n=1 Tax=Pedobacter hartonius TaxID=425514 RepID=A0A1H4HCH9_9SPHI|nr:cardiolipin synthase [Pedobacter hartonius]SEB19160.1 cardiolipin synthase [Pedobacter hartonius]